MASVAESSSRTFADDMRNRTDRRVSKDTKPESNAASDVAGDDGLQGATANPLAVSVRDGSKRTNLGRSTLYELMAAGELPYVQIRGRRLLLVDDLAALLRRFRCTTQSR
jgi:excisionase family DNA binding protein